MKMHDIIAAAMYEVNRLFLESAGEKLPEWKDVPDKFKTYWYALADAAFECLMEPDEDMIKGALQEWRKPVKVQENAGWDEQRTADFLRINMAALTAGQVDWASYIAEK